MTHKEFRIWAEELAEQYPNDTRNYWYLDGMLDALSTNTWSITPWGGWPTPSPEQAACYAAYLMGWQDAKNS